MGQRWGHSPAQTSGGRGGWQPGTFRTPLSLPLLLLAGRRPPPLCLDSIDHVTLRHETRICRLPKAAQQIAAPRATRDPT